MSASEQKAVCHCTCVYGMKTSYVDDTNTVVGVVRCLV
jgi:hypothetical protein